MGLRLYLSAVRIGNLKLMINTMIHLRTYKIMKYALIAEINNAYQERIGESFLDHYSEEIVALFDDKQKALDYIKESKLKHPQKFSYGSDKIFKNKSLLSSAKSARIEEHGEPEYILNPKL